MELERQTGVGAQALPSVERVCVVGLGFAGLPTAAAIATAGHETIGLDLDSTKVARINAGQATSGISAGSIAPLVEAGALKATVDASAISDAGIVLISVPTPIDRDGKPNEEPVIRACETVLEHVAEGALIVMQSTVLPGTTRQLLVDPLNASGRFVGEDVFVASSPERINPGDPVFHVGNTARLVAGATDACLARGLKFVDSFVSKSQPVASLETAELAKLVENTFRFINISFVNEIAVLADRLNVNAWDVIDAAATKPFSFMPHYPGPGIGGECIPVSPRYLQAAAERRGIVSELIPAGFRATGRMPEHVVDRLAGLLAERGRTLPGSRVVVVGLTYKPGVGDIRHSPAAAVIRSLESRRAQVLVHDPHVPGIIVDDVFRPSVPLDMCWPEGAVTADAAVVVTPHKEIDYAALAAGVGVVLDTRNALRGLNSERIVSL
jgi:UDP-N-acetyl-D-glucosamine dehydrogenase